MPVIPQSCSCEPKSEPAKMLPAKAKIRIMDVRALSIADKENYEPLPPVVYQKTWNHQHPSSRQIPDHSWQGKLCAVRGKKQIPSFPH